MTLGGYAKSRGDWTKFSEIFQFWADFRSVFHQKLAVFTRKINVRREIPDRLEISFIPVVTRAPQLIVAITGEKTGFSFSPKII